MSTAAEHVFERMQQAVPTVQRKASAPPSKHAYKLLAGSSISAMHALVSSMRYAGSVPGQALAGLTCDRVPGCCHQHPPPPGS